ncbi:MAG: DEAD/DEAH box helicase family protein [Nitrospiraceae bacterium]|nr:DEAD/DEAH box helicase family protein [Nitrospiraceae bacterium]
MDEKNNDMNDFRKYFPYKTLREPQKRMISRVWDAIINKRHIFINAPTGIGKTAGALVPSVRYIVEENPKVKVFFLTSANSHHFTAVDTLKDLRDNQNIKIITADILGKKWMCSFKDVKKLSSSEFNNYCKLMRQERKCEYYVNTRDKKDKLTPKAVETVALLKSISPCTNTQIINFSAQDGLCAYEIATELAKKAQVIVGDYNYLFDPSIRDLFLRKVGVDPGNVIVIVDEAHNLIKRMRSLFTSKISTFSVVMAIKEAKKSGFDEQAGYLIKINDVLNSFLDDIEKNASSNKRYNKGVSEMEMLISEEDLVSRISEIGDYDDIVSELMFVGDKIRKLDKKSFVGSVADFLNMWNSENEEGFVRLVRVREGMKNSKNEISVSVEKICLDPSSMINQTVNSSHTTIFMSATLSPVSMYRDLFGLDENNSEVISFKDPFPENNRLNMIIPKTTTRFARRSRSQFEEIGKVCSELITAANVNTAVFMPSYKLLNSIGDFIEENLKKNLMSVNVIREKPNLSQDEKDKILKSLKKNNNQVILAVASGSFSEAVDLPGDALQMVIVVGLPLATPDLETKELIKYYDFKFKKGMLYAYIYPAMTKVIQAAGRCIRSERDKGVLVFLDERYSWPMYRECFPEDWSMIIEPKNYVEKIRDFFGN